MTTRFRVSASLLAITLMSAAPGRAVIVNGVGPASTDCFVAFSITADHDLTASGTKVEQKACGGSCTFHVFAQSGVGSGGSCNLPALKKVTSNAGIGAPSDLTASSCSAAPKDVTLTVKGKHPKKKTITLVAVSDTKPAKKDKDKAVLICTPNPTDAGCTALAGGCSAPAGSRVFKIGPSSHVYAGLLGPDQPADVAGTQFGTLDLVKGTPGPDGVATLALGCDAVFGIAVVDGSYACLKIEAAGSSGKIDCDGGTPVDVVVTGDSHENTDGHNDTPTSQIEQGTPGPAGSAYLKFTARFVNCANDGSHDGVAGGCLQPFCSTADCADPTKVDFSKSKLLLSNGVATTGKATTAILNAKGNNVKPITKTGAPFDCANFTQAGTGILETPALFYDFPLLSGDVTAMLQAGE